MAASIAGCEKKNESSSSSLPSDTSAAVSESSDESDASGDTDVKIDEKRKNSDFEGLKKDALALINEYYAGMEKKNYDQFISVFPDFYQKAFEDETKNEYHQTNDQCITQLHDEFEITYGEDFYIVPEIIDSGILQLGDDSIEELNKMIADTFDVKDVKVTDAYSVNFQQITRGSKHRDSNPMEFLMIKIGKKYYLYDNYYTDKKGV